MIDTRPYREIRESDVGRPTFNAFGQKWLCQNFIGEILPQDVGKRVYLIGDILRVENDEQRNARLAKTR